MRWFNNLNMATKNLLTLGLLCAAPFAVALIAHNAAARVQFVERELVDKSNIAALHLLECRADLNRIRGRMFERFLTPSVPEQLAIKLEIEGGIEDVWTRLSSIRRILVVKNDASDLVNLGRIEKQLVSFFAGRAEVAQFIEQADTEAAKAMLLGIQHQRFEALRLALVELSDRILDRSREAVAESERSDRSANLTLILVCLAALLFAALVLWWMNRQVVVPLRAVADLAVRVAAGDLTVQVETDGRRDEVGLLQQSLQIMVQNLATTNRELRDGFSVLNASSSEIFATISQVAVGASETASATTKTAMVAEEVKQTAIVSNQKAQAVQIEAERHLQISEVGMRAVAATIEGMNRIHVQMTTIMDTITQLSEHSQSIGEIIAMVNDLAEQSNLLAVNAAIEATRAGEFGRSFTVVAQEVRSLAEQSRQATSHVRSILMDVQKATAGAVKAAELGTTAVVAGLQQASDSGRSIQVLSEGVSNAAQTAAQIAVFSQRQLDDIDQMTAAIAYIRHSAAQDISATQKLEEAANRITELGQKVEALLARQRIAA